MKPVNYNQTHIGHARTWSECGAVLRAQHPGDRRIERIAHCLEMGILGELSWRAVEGPASFTIASAFGTSGLALVMMVQQ